MSLIKPEVYLAYLRWEGLTVIEHTVNGINWRDHCRPSNLGSWNPCGIINHHTATKTSIENDLHSLWFGRSDLPGPLCQAGLDRRGNIHLVGWNRCNHAGKGANNVLDAVVKELPTPSPNMNLLVDGNRYFYGLEVMNDGLGEALTPEQEIAVLKYNTAVTKAHNWTEKSCIYHKTWTTNKSDLYYLKWMKVTQLQSAVAAYKTGDFTVDQEAREAFATLSAKLAKQDTELAKIRQLLDDIQTWGTPSGRVVVDEKNTTLYLQKDDGTLSHIPTPEQADWLKHHRIAADPGVVGMSELVIPSERVRDAVYMAGPGSTPIFDDIEKKLTDDAAPTSELNTNLEDKSKVPSQVNIPKR